MLTDIGIWHARNSERLISASYSVHEFIVYLLKTPITTYLGIQPGVFDVCLVRLYDQGLQLHLFRLSLRFDLVPLDNVHDFHFISFLLLHMKPTYNRLRTLQNKTMHRPSEPLSARLNESILEKSVSICNSFQIFTTRWQNKILADISWKTR